MPALEIGVAALTDSIRAAKARIRSLLASVSSLSTEITELLDTPEDLEGLLLTLQFEEHLLAPRDAAAGATPGASDALVLPNPQLTTGLRHRRHSLQQQQSKERVMRSPADDRRQLQRSGTPALSYSPHSLAAADDDEDADSGSGRHERQGIRVNKARRRSLLRHLHAEAEGGGYANVAAEQQPDHAASIFVDSDDAGGSGFLLRGRRRVHRLRSSATQREIQRRRRQAAEEEEEELVVAGMDAVEVMLELVLAQADSLKDVLARGLDDLEVADEHASLLTAAAQQQLWTARIVLSGIMAALSFPITVAGFLSMNVGRQSPSEGWLSRKFADFAWTSVGLSLTALLLFLCGVMIIRRR